MYLFLKIKMNVVNCQKKISYIIHNQLKFTIKRDQVWTEIITNIDCKIF